LAIEVDAGVLPFMVRHRSHPQLGARPMRDAVEKHIRDACAEAILARLQIHGGVLRVAGERLALDRPVAAFG
jgi:ATP-dependent Clp protease ATP-binding subunit ClpA